MESSRQQIIILSQDSSLLPIKDIIGNCDPNKVAIGFDVDGTLTDLNTKNSFVPRGGDETVELFKFLDGNSIKWFAISARPYNVNTLQGVASSLHIMGIECPDWVKRNAFKLDKQNSIVFDVTEKKDAFVLDDNVYTILECNNIISAVLPNSRDSYDKFASFEYAISEHFIEYPELLIFIDDNAQNIVLLYEYFKRVDRRFVGVLYMPHKEESGHADFMLLVGDIIGVA